MTDCPEGICLKDRRMCPYYDDAMKCKQWTGKRIAEPEEKGEQE